MGSTVETCYSELHVILEIVLMGFDCTSPLNIISLFPISTKVLSPIYCVSADQTQLLKEIKMQSYLFVCIFFFCLWPKMLLTFSHMH